MNKKLLVCAWATFSAVFGGSFVVGASEEAFQEAIGEMFSSVAVLARYRRGKPVMPRHGTESEMEQRMVAAYAALSFNTNEPFSAEKMVTIYMCCEDDDKTRSRFIRNAYRIDCEAVESYFTSLDDERLKEFRVFIERRFGDAHPLTLRLNSRKRPRVRWMTASLLAEESGGPGEYDVIDVEGK